MSHLHQPRRQTGVTTEGIFSFESPVLKSYNVSPMERQRDADGTPMTVSPPSRLRPQGLDVVMKGVSAPPTAEQKTLAKGQDAQERLAKAREVIANFLAE